MRAVALALLALSSQAAAEVALAPHPAFDTRFGPLRVQPAPYGQQLYFNGAPLADLNDAHVAIQGAWAVAGEPWDWVLVEIAHNGNMCPARLVMLRVGQGSLARTGEFAECLGQVRDVRVTGGGMTVSVTDPEVGVSHRDFFFDGANFTVTPIAAATAPPAGGGSDVLRWNGDSLYSVLQEASERARFQRIMTGPQLEELRRRTSVGAPSVRSGDWIVGGGCMAHQCNVSGGLWAIRISDGTPVAAFFDEGGREQWFGIDPRSAGAEALLGPAARWRLK